MIVKPNHWCFKFWHRRQKAPITNMKFIKSMPTIEYAIINENTSDHPANANYQIYTPKCQKGASAYLYTVREKI